MSTFQPSAVTPRDVAVESCEVCIVGAGVAGLNALFVASQYLSRDQKVILVDRRERVGGMWVDTYPYVRLHQPHGMFTAGNIEWTLGQDRSYLATKGEVLDHFEHCLKVIKQRVRVDEFFGWAIESHDETDGIVRITCRSSDGRRVVVEAKRLIKAYGFQSRPTSPSRSPASASCRCLLTSATCDGRNADQRAPVWIIGGGKTAMDTAHALITEYPGREVNLVAGSGTYFLPRPFLSNRGSAMVARQVLQQPRARRNSSFRRHERDRCQELVPQYIRHLVNAQTGNFLVGLLSESENKTIAAGLNDVIMDHLVDVVDRNGSTDLVFRSGSPRRSGREAG